jgi:predicted ATP-binding protein involved in virulence
MTSKYVYFTKLELENVRAFGDRQELFLTNNSDSAVPAQWTLIIGENGVGKTTLLQCLANMCPVPSWHTGDEKANSQKPTCVRPAILDEFDNDTFDALARSENDVNLKLELKASLSIGRRFDDADSEKGAEIFTSLSAAFKRESGNLKSFDPSGSDLSNFEEPLVIGYGASRHMGKANSNHFDSKIATSSLFDALIELVDAEVILQELDYSRLKKDKGAATLLKLVKAALATILPDIRSSNNIKIYGPSGLGLNGKKGVHVETFSGLVPFSSLSLGYQTMSAWTIDIAWRLFKKYPESSNPLFEPAIILIDEIDLHLHPKWQRQVRSNLSKHFPNVQFIATAHSPLMAQSYLDANLAVVRRDENQAVIVNDPIVMRDWRLDQILTSELFDFDSARPTEIELKLQRRVELVRKEKRTLKENKELQQLDHEVEQLPSETLPADNEAMEIIRRAALALQQVNKS